jgi:hypothetical protein
VGRTAGLSRSDVERIIGLVKAEGWTWRENGTASYLLFPPNNSAPPMTLRHSRSGAFLTYRELRNRGVEADPMRLLKTKSAKEAEEEFNESWLADEGIREDKPLVPGYEPSDTARTYSFSHHALERINERHVHVYEVYAAIDQYDYGTSMRNGHSDYHLFVRGAVEVVVHKPTRTIVTVIDLRQSVRTEPRVPSCPQPVVVIPKPEEAMAKPPQFSALEPSTPDVEEVVPVAAKRGRKAGEVPYTDRVRVYLSGLKAKTITTITEIHNAVPGGSQSGIIKLLINLRRLDYVRTTRRRGEYQIIHPQLIGKTMVGKEHVVKVRPPSHLKDMQQKAYAVSRGELPSVRDRIKEFLTTVKPGDEFGRKQVREMLGDVGLSTVAGQLRKLTEEGILVEWAAEGQYLYKLRTATSGVDEFLASLKPGEGFSITQVMTATGSTISRGDMRKLLDEMCLDGRLRSRGGAGSNLFWEIPLPARVPVQATAPARDTFADLDDDEDVEPVEVGFEFAPLPDSAVYDVAAVVKRHYQELQDHPGNWVRISVYDGGRGADVAKKRAAKVDQYLDDPALQFVVRAISETQVGLFVRYRTSVSMR